MSTQINPRRQIKPGSISGDLLSPEVLALLNSQSIPSSLEPLVGALDGNNVVFQIPKPYEAVSIFLNGMMLEKVRDFVFNADSQFITLQFVPDQYDRLTYMRFSATAIEGVGTGALTNEQAAWAMVRQPDEYGVLTLAAGT